MPIASPSPNRGRHGPALLLVLVAGVAGTTVAWILSVDRGGTVDAAADGPVVSPFFPPEAAPSAFRSGEGTAEVHAQPTTVARSRAQTALDGAGPVDSPAEAADSDVGGERSHAEARAPLSARLSPREQTLLVGEPCYVRVQFRRTGPHLPIGLTRLESTRLLVRHESDSEWRRVATMRKPVRRGTLVDELVVVPREVVFALEAGRDRSAATGEGSETPWGPVEPRSYPLRRPGAYTIRIGFTFALEQGEPLRIEAGTCTVRIRAPSHPSDQRALEELLASHALTVDWAELPRDTDHGTPRPPSAYVEWFDDFVERHWGSAYIPHAVVQLVRALESSFGPEAWARAEALLRRTLTDYPSSPDRDHLLYLLGSHLSRPSPAGRLRPREALGVFTEIVAEHPDSEWADEAKEKIAEQRARLKR